MNSKKVYVNQLKQFLYIEKMEFRPQKDVTATQFRVVSKH